MIATEKQLRTKKTTLYFFFSLYCLVLLLLIILTKWQFEKGVIKRDIENIDKNKISIIDLSLGWEDIPQYQDIQLTGKWQNQENIFLENRIHQQKLGFEIVTPLLLQDNTIILVNRGWIPKKTKDLSDVTPAHSNEVTGTIYVPQKRYQFTKNKSDSMANTYQQLNLEQIKNDIFAQRKLIQSVLVLEKNHPDAFTKIWNPHTMSSARHFGYAFQWLCLTALHIVFGFIWFKKRTV